MPSPRAPPAHSALIFARSKMPLAPPAAAVALLFPHRRSYLRDTTTCARASTSCVYCGGTSLLLWAALLDFRFTVCQSSPVPVPNNDATHPPNAPKPQMKFQTITALVGFAAVASALNTFDDDSTGCRTNVMSGWADFVFTVGYVGTWGYGMGTRRRYPPLFISNFRKSRTSPLQRGKPGVHRDDGTQPGPHKDCKRWCLLSFAG